MDGYKITSFFLSSRLLHVPGHLPCGKDGGICRMDSEEEQQCFAEHVACLDAPNGIVLFLVSEAVEKQLSSPSVVNVLQLTSELNQFAQEALAQIQATGNQGNINTQESLAQLGEVSETLSTIYQHDINQIEDIFKQSAVVRTNWASHVIRRYSLAVGDIYGIGRLPFLASLYRYFKSQSDFII